MRKWVYILFALALFSCKSSPQNREIAAIKAFQDDLNSEYRNPQETPLRGENFKNFTAHPFFPIDLKYRVIADFKKLENSSAFQMPTSSGKTKTYKAYGTASFKLNGKKYTLTLFQSEDLKKQKAYADYLFLPFHDLTNTHETYGGGKYLDLKVPSSNKIIIDFNQSYQPYCAYNAHDYNCPVVPEENRLPVRIEAGVKYLNTYFEH